MYTGVALSVTATSLFAGLYYYATLLQPLSGEEIFGLRILMTLPIVTLFMALTKEWPRVVEIVQRIRARPALVIPLACSSALLGVQQWLFMWAPLNGSAPQVSLGYFLLPLSMLTVGRLLYREKLSMLKTAEVVTAAVGVAHAVIQAGGFSWEAITVCFGFPAYFVLRKALSTDHLGGLWFDMLLTLPVAAWFILREPATVNSFSGRTALYPLVILLGVISAVAYMCYIAASSQLSLSSFGLLGYVEPVLMVAVALLIGEHIDADEWWTYLLIWCAVLLLVADGIQHLRAANRSLPIRHGAQ
ncbi:EamA family transporter RarD (plasmid) [Variovorax sp. V213]|uniref:EamA family transporter RarD n=1 Tax=Variovorax sp. V213 TaxID=3065955 RepID=UPI0034E8A3E0